MSYTARMPPHRTCGAFPLSPVPAMPDFPDAALESIRHQLLAMLDDCDSFDCERLRWRLHTADCAQDLWLLRTAVRDMVAAQHCGGQATERVDRLEGAFRRVLPGTGTYPIDTVEMSP
ncbi:hypothetical protein HK414_23565 [Ramlibacter terrae]|uniref:Uncharacterized protein n=1 Tax=Ramlibacter terrae TaxID=2732511 RepID=A0ABX6P8I9_9BURK|nr:hypothetical protein HK414_23565 [Ramlibacter terrae]